MIQQYEDHSGWFLGSELQANVFSIGIDNLSGKNLSTHARTRGRTCGCRTQKAPLGLMLLANRSIVLPRGCGLMEVAFRERESEERRKDSSWDEVSIFPFLFHSARDSIDSTAPPAAKGI